MLDHFYLHNIIGNNDSNGGSRLGSDFGDLYAHALVGDRVLPVPPEPDPYGPVLLLDAGTPFSLPPNQTIWNDLSGNGYIGNLNSGVSYSSEGGGCLEFHGGNEAVITNYTQTNVVDYTISIWFKGATYGTGLISNRGITGSSGKGFCFLFGYSPFITKLFYGVNSDLMLTGAQASGNVDSSTLNDGSWHNVVGVFDGQSGVLVTGSQIKIYLDGQLITTSSYNAFFRPVPPLSGLQGTIIGRGFPSGGAHIGKISVVSIYDTPLTEAQIINRFDYYRTRYGI